MEMMKAKVFLSSTGDVSFAPQSHSGDSVQSQGHMSRGKRGSMYSYPHFFLEQFRARRIVIMETINAQSTKRTVGSFEAFCLFILLLFTHTHFPVHIISLPHPHFMDLSLHPHFPVHLEF